LNSASAFAKRSYAPSFIGWPSSAQVLRFRLRCLNDDFIVDGGDDLSVFRQGFMDLTESQFQAFRASTLNNQGVF
jgi:hypothetical protein